MNTSLVTILIVTWNSMNYLYDCLQSLSRQTFKNFSIIIIDNGSSDGTVEYVRKNYPAVSILQNFRNMGFSYANNQGIKLAKSPYVLALNPDIIINDDFLEQIVQCAKKHPNAGSVCGKLFKLSSSQIDPEISGKGLRTPIKSDVLDAAGLILLKSRKALNRGEGDKDNDNYQKEIQVFGASGCCALYRKNALQDVMLFNEYFDEDFFTYKEDVDLAWRLRLYGWESWYTPLAVGYHYRGFSSSKEKTTKKIIESRQKVSKAIRSLSFINHHLMIVKNELLPLFFINFFPIFFYELRVFLYILFFESFQIKNFNNIIANMPKMMKKRKIIMSSKKLNAKEMRQWFQ